jgi:hypothetical protein
LKKKKNSIKKGKAQARIPGPAIFFKSSAPVCFIKKKKELANDVLLVSPKFNIHCGCWKIWICRFFVPKNSFFQPFQPQNTFITPKNQSINLINPKKKVQTTKTNWKKYCILDLDLVF